MFCCLDHYCTFFMLSRLSLYFNTSLFHFDVNKKRKLFFCQKSHDFLYFGDSISIFGLRLSGKSSLRDLFKNSFPCLELHKVNTCTQTKTVFPELINHPWDVGFWNSFFRFLLEIYFFILSGKKSIFIIGF